MQHQHAATYRDRLTTGDLDYLARKANKLGLEGKQIFSVTEEKDVDGTHIYFHVLGVHGQSKNAAAFREEGGMATEEYPAR